MNEECFEESKEKVKRREGGKERNSRRKYGGERGMKS